MWNFSHVDTVLLQVCSLLAMFFVDRRVMDTVWSLRAVFVASSSWV